MTETEIQEACRRALASLGAKVIKIHGDAYMEKGTPDLIGCFRGRTFAIEIKTKTGRLDPLQAYRLSQWQKSGAIIGVARSPSEAVAIVENPDQCFSEEEITKALRRLKC